MSLSRTKSFFITHGNEVFPKQLHKGVVAIGNFDGLHRGHRAVLDVAHEQGAALNAPVFAMTFEPHPRTVFNPDNPVFRLSPETAKAELLRLCDLDGMLVIPFSRNFASVTAETFVNDILVEHLNVSHVVTGHDFHFGKQRKGTPDFLRQSGASKGFGVTIVNAENDEGNIIISSTRVRQALAEGDIPHANALLGYRWFFDGTVTHGDKRGRDLGYPTANLQVDETFPLKYGIYAVQVVLDGQVINGVASYGRRPTFDNGKALFEVHLFDFSQDIYGQKIRVHLLSHLRGEEKFSSAEALIQQMDQDSMEARAAIASLEPLSELDQKLLFSVLN